MGTGRAENLFRMGDDLVWADCGPEDDQEMVLKIIDKDTLPGWVADRWNIEQQIINASGQLSIQTKFLTPLPGKVILGRWRQTSPVRELKGILTFPTLRPDGSLLDRPGYDDATGYWLLRSPELAIPAEPNQLDIAAAEALINSTLEEFPWVDDDQKATFIGMWMLPAVMLLCPPPWPLLILDAKQRGSGKTLLAEVCGMTYSRYELHPPLDVRTRWGQEELRKKILGSLLSDARTIIFDNVVGTIDLPTLTSLLTSTMWTDRMLGKSKVVTRPNDKLWVVTGNTVSLGDDLIRRSCWVSIDPQRVNPWNRQFAKDLYAWVPKNRSDLIRAFLILGRAWVQNGSQTLETRGDVYGQTLGTAAGILANAGFKGTPFLMRQIDEGGSEDDLDTLDAIKILGSYFGKDEFGTLEVVPQLASTNVLNHKATISRLGWCLPENTRRLAKEVMESGGSDSAPLNRAVGQWLRRLEGKRFDEGVLIRTQKRSGANPTLYRVEGPASELHVEIPNTVPDDNDEIMF
jgi:hypothetical protein